MQTTTVRPDQEHHAHHSHRPLYIKIFVALMFLLIATVVAAKLPLGGANLWPTRTPAIGWASAFRSARFFLIRSPGKSFSTADTGSQIAKNEFDCCCDLRSGICDAYQCE